MEWEWECPKLLTMARVQDVGFGVETEEDDNDEVLADICTYINIYI